MVKKHFYIKASLFYLIAALLCGYCMAGPTYSFLQLSSQSQTTGLNQSADSTWSAEGSLGKALAVYRELTQESSSNTDSSNNVASLPMITTSNLYSSGFVGPYTGKSASAPYNNPSIVGSNGLKWGYWYRSKKHSASGWDGIGPASDIEPPCFPDSPGDGPSIKPGPNGSGYGSIAVPAPAAVSLGCIGMVLVGWLRSRKAF